MAFAIILSFICALFQWYLSFVANLIFGLWQNPKSLMTWSMAWPHLVILLIMMMMMISMLKWLIKFLILLWTIIKWMLIMMKPFRIILKWLQET
ncbi:TPA_asm: P overlapped [Wurfbainia alphacytorhabdovirus 1]|nr:TPA_asm: P overlapped [Wurfbainia alphacytorhabdovirus 1]